MDCISANDAVTGTESAQTIKYVYTEPCPILSNPSDFLEQLRDTYSFTAIDNRESGNSEISVMSVQLRRQSVADKN